MIGLFTVIIMLSDKENKEVSQQESGVATESGTPPRRNQCPVFVLREDHFEHSWGGKSHNLEFLKIFLEVFKNCLCIVLDLKGQFF